MSKKNKKQELFSSFTFSHMSHFICNQTCLKRNKNFKKELILGFGGLEGVKVQVYHSSCASQYKNATSRTTLLSTWRV